MQPLNGCMKAFGTTNCKPASYFHHIQPLPPKVPTHHIRAISHLHGSGDAPSLAEKICWSNNFALNENTLPETQTNALRSGRENRI
jgi:hypothetical protein